MKISGPTLPTQCPACLGEGRGTPLVVEDRYRLVRCSGCRSEYFRPDESLHTLEPDAEVSHYWEDYKFDVYADEGVQREFERRYSALFSTARTFTESLDSVLDVGCGIGNFLAFAEDAGMHAYGIDIEPAAVEVARSRGLRAEVNIGLDELVPDRSVDAITLWDVIEHLYEPEPLLTTVLAKVRPGGVVLLETPDATFWPRRVLLAGRTLTAGKLDLTDYMYYWEHKIYFSEEGLSSILARLGCPVVHVERETSPKEKMQDIFDRDADASWRSRILSKAWPFLEAASHRLGRGNKLLAIAKAQG